MKGTRRLKDRIKKEMKDPAFRVAFEEEEVFSTIAIALAKIRKKNGLTQQDLAKRMHTSQQMVSRLEDADNRSYSLKTLVKAAHVLKKHLQVKFV